MFVKRRASLDTAPMVRRDRLARNGLRSRWRCWRHPPSTGRPLYQVTDRLHDGRTVRVPAPEIAGTVSGWLAELGVRSPLVEQLARAVRDGDWTTAHALGDHLSVDVSPVP